MTIHLSAILFFSGFISSIVIANLIDAMIVGKVNRRRAESDQISHFGWTLSKSNFLIKEYRELYPNGKLHYYSRIMAGAAALFLLLCVLNAFDLGRILTHQRS